MIVDSPPPLAPDMPTSEPAPLPLADVRQDMAAIFGVPPAAPIAPAAKTLEIPIKGGIAAARTSRRRGIATPVLAAATAGLLIGMAAMGSLGLTDLRIDRALAPVAAPATGVADNPFERADPSTPQATTATAAPTASEPATAIASPAARAASAPARSDEPDRAPTPAAPAEAKRAPQRNLAEECEGDRLERAWCMRHDILEADRRLRRAYAEAIRQGVERRYLVIHQRSWSRLRARAESDPNGVLEGYRELAGDLERLSVNGRAADRIR